MQSRLIVVIALLLVALWHGFNEWQQRPVHPPDGIIAALDPVQTDLEDGPLNTMTRGRWRLTPKARYDVTARILSREDYHFDLLSSLIPEDLALGWGAMSDNRVLQAFEITQGARFYSWRPKAELPISRQDVIAHSANTHVIPATAFVSTQLSQLRVGQVVHLSGYLVDGVRDDGAYIHTSLTRSDSGAGACEVVLVEELDTPE
ncbi:MAG TPA: hypothetical protein VLW26_04770 [Steroidobacteraceae bacterium]|nr:hypothetical protein [Steroidobacteraceae bacterium]